MSGTEDPQEQTGAGPFRDAESWLVERGVRRDPLVVPAPEDRSSPSGAPPERSSRPAETREDAADGDGGQTTAERRLDDQVTEALTYARRATATTPHAEARLRAKVEARGYAPAVVDEAMARARSQGLVDDHAYARALVDEGRAKGHAPLRIRTDLEKRDVGDEAVEAALATIGDRDPEARAFAVAYDRAERLRSVDAETAYRRLVGYLARRGYTEALSRKVARQAVFDDREPQRTAER